MNIRTKTLVSCVLTCVLVACGGGGGSNGQPNTPPPIPPDPSPSSKPAFGCQSQPASSDQGEVQNRYTLFESGHVRPMALSPDGTRLYVVNTPNNCLEVFATDDALTPVAAIPVGLEPVAVAAPTNNEVWVVNQLSDSVSVIDVSGTPKVKETLWVGDEPRDIVFAGPNRQRAFITSAYRGQNHPTFQDVHLRENGHGRADVWVFDRTALGTAAGGTPLTVANLFSDIPRALAVSNDGATVYAAAFMSGNRTTVLEQQVIQDETGDSTMVVLGYYRNAEGGNLTTDQVAWILGIDPGLAEETVELPYLGSSMFQINDQGQLVLPSTGMVFEIATPDGVKVFANPDPQVAESGRTKPLPNTNSEGASAPLTGLIVKFDGEKWRDESATDWSDKINFTLPDYDVFEIDAMAEKPVEKSRIAHVGTTLFNMAVNPASGKLYVSNLEARNDVRFEGPGLNATSVRGNIAQSRISVVANGAVVTRNLNKHLTHAESQGDSIAAAEKAKTLSQPMQMALTANGETLYVAAMGSNKIGIFNTQALEQDTFMPDAAAQITLPSGGPTGVVLNGDGTRLYVTTRYDNSVLVINTADRQVVATKAMFSPEPQSVIDGRRFLYDAELTSANGENACSSCHIFGDVDALAWDLGNPDAGLQEKPIIDEVSSVPASEGPSHPMKGPMATQTMRGMLGHGAMHWRGDRTGNTLAIVNGVAESREAAAFKEFNGAFVELVGREQPLSDTQMQQFTDFALQVMPPPNPIRALDNSLTASQSLGRDIYMTKSTAFSFTCNDCHEVDAQKKRFGTDGTLSNEGGRVSQDFKVAQLRAAYTKVGRFDDGGEQIRGYGFLHDGSETTLLRFLSGSVFQFNSNEERNQVSDFVYAMESNFAPVVGQQVTVTSSNKESAQVRLDLLAQRAQAQECDLVAAVVIDGASVQAVAQSATQFVTTGGATVSRDQLLQQLPVTFTCYPPGNAQRLM